MGSRLFRFSSLIFFGPYAVHSRHSGLFQFCEYAIVPHSSEPLQALSSLPGAPNPTPLTSLLLSKLQMSLPHGNGEMGSGGEAEQKQNKAKQKTLLNNCLVIPSSLFIQATV